MNHLSGKICGITQSANMILAEVDVSGVLFTTITIGVAEASDYVKIGNPVSLLINESEISIAKNLQGQVSQNNRIDCAVIDLIKGEIFTQVKLRFGENYLESLITTRSVNRLELQIGDAVTAMVKTNEVFLKRSTEASIGADQSAPAKEAAHI
jgi:molybdopterin-binding protein